MGLPFQCQFQNPGEDLAEGVAGSLHHARVAAVLGEAGNCVDFVEHHLAVRGQEQYRSSLPKSKNVAKYVALARVSGGKSLKAA